MKYRCGYSFLGSRQKRYETVMACSFHSFLSLFRFVFFFYTLLVFFSKKWLLLGKKKQHPVGATQRKILKLENVFVNESVALSGLSQELCELMVIHHLNARAQYALMSRVKYAPTDLGHKKTMHNMCKRFKMPQCRKGC